MPMAVYTFTYHPAGRVSMAQSTQNAWRPGAHSFLAVLATAFATRLVTQMYFTGIRC
jgi:protocatechuate 3,4-dioxygenase beta subunit